VRHAVALALVLALAAGGAALAARGDPQKRLVPADQARAKSMLVRTSDLSPAFVARPAATGGGDFYCAALDESDLTVAGEATSPYFTAAPEFVASTASVYASERDSDISWKRGTSAAGQKCLRTALRSELQGGSVRLLSFERIAFPRRGQRSVAFRATASQQGVRVYLDLVAIQVSRAQAGVVYVSGLVPPPRAELARLTSIVAGRMAKAMQGS
jgi:hypothetical protein